MSTDRPPAPGSMPLVRTTAGTVRGTWETGVAAFRGIPFAQPPVGALRFRAPEPIRPWDGVRDAVAFGPAPPQPDVTDRDVAAAQARSEDWLTLNVWSPDPRPGAGLPTMVWIHGGAYSMGASSLPEYDGARLASGGVVLVTFNYRVGMEGFGQIDGAPANRGLLDQIAALHWVHENIVGFGGDPDGVTVFGESAGGGSVAALLAMPRATGLFRRAVAQSVPGTFFSSELAHDIASSCAATLGLRPTVAELSAVTPARLGAAGDAIGAGMPEHIHRWGAPAYRAIPFSPVVDGDVLPVTPWQALAAGRGRDLELLVGHTRDEQRLLSALDGTLGDVTEEQAAVALDLLAPRPAGMHAYREGFPDAGPEQLYELVISDWLFRMPSLHLADAQLAAGGRVHVFELTWPAPGMGGILGACHGLDVPLVFGNLDRGLPALLIGDLPNPEAEALSGWMRAAWAAFATEGDPGWPAFEAPDRLVRVFDTPASVAAYPEEMSRRIWRDHVFGPLPLRRSEGEGS